MSVREKHEEAQVHMSAKEGSYTLSSALIFTGVVGLVACTYVSFRVGWSLADDLIDRFATASILGLADFASAVLIAVGARMRNYGWKARSYGAVLVALAFVAIGYLSAYGFFSTRIAVHEAQKVAVAVEKENLSWLRQQFVNTEIPRWQRQAMLNESKAATKELRRTASVVSDKYAAAIASLFSWTLEQAQTRLTIAIAATAYAVKFSGLWFGMMMWPWRRRETEQADAKISSTQKGGSGDAGSGVKSTEESKPKQDENVVPLRATDVKSSAVVPQSEKVGQPPPTVRRVQSGAPLPLTLKTSHVSIPALIAANPGKRWESISDLAKDAGVSVPTAWRAVENARGQGKVETSRKGRGVQVIAKPRKSGTNGAFHAYPH